MQKGENVDPEHDDLDFLSPKDKASSSSSKPILQLKKLKPYPKKRPPSAQLPTSSVPQYTARLPTRDNHGTLHFEEPYSRFTPNLTPSEVVQLGSFGGTFFRQYYSHVLQSDIQPDYNEFPAEWFIGLRDDGTPFHPPTYMTKDTYDAQVNNYGVKAGQSLEAWEKAGWVTEQDPRGWFQWYCRFYLGRRTSDDERQIDRCEHSLP